MWLTLTLLLYLLTLVSATPLPQLSPQDVQQLSIFSTCLTNAGLNPITITSTTYDTDSAAYNRRIQPHPLAIVHPNNSNGVSEAVKCAAAGGYRVVTRGGGHSYASHGVGGTDGALVIDLNNFKGITVNSDGTAVMGGGVRLGDLAVEFDRFGRALPHGVCPWVGIGGHASFGGFGYTSRMWGLSVDSVIGYDVVLANGTLLRNVTPQVDADLFWALKGAGPDFGIVTFFYFKTFAQPPLVQHFTYTYLPTKISANDTISLFTNFQSFARYAAPPELGISFNIGPSGYIVIHGNYYGTRNMFDTIIAPLENTFLPAPNGPDKIVLETTYMGSVDMDANGQPLNSAGNVQPRDTFYVKSLMTPSADADLLTNAAITSFINKAFSTGVDTLAWWIEINLWGGLLGFSAINSLPLTSSSFAHRDKLFNFQIYGSSLNYAPPYPANGIAVIQGLYDSIVNPMGRAWAGKVGAYVNYVDSQLSQAEAEKLYWGPQLARLKTLKARYDPLEVFKRPQSIAA